jgi:FkbM family methyltransferase
MNIEQIRSFALQNTKAQLQQDIFVLEELGYKQDGFFVEFGATDGVEFSNTWILEKHFGWVGILAEPARSWHEDLKKNRTCNIETDCVWKESYKTLLFNESTECSMLSTIDEYSLLDEHASKRVNGNRYLINTISLQDLLLKYNAPHDIDYLSIDTEGSEFEILNAFPFDKYNIRTITCEHNFTPLRDKIYTLLTQKGYVRKHEAFSRWDDWYVKQ